MKKHAIFTFRMSRIIREGLNKAAQKERRSVASLLDKIIGDYLEKEGFLRELESAHERRGFPREKVTLAAETLVKKGSEVESFPTVVEDISLGGAMLTYPRGSPVRFTLEGKLPHFGLRFDLPSEDRQICFRCDALHIHDTGSQIQVGVAFRDPDDESLQSLKAYIWH